MNIIRRRRGEARGGQGRDNTNRERPKCDGNHDPHELKIGEVKVTRQLEGLGGRERWTRNRGFSGTGGKSKGSRKGSSRENSSEEGAIVLTRGE